MDIHAWQLIALLAVGLLAGTLGGMLGVGGSVIMIPAMVALFGQGRPDTPGLNQHLYQASAMIVNVCVVLPAVWRHRQAHAIVGPALKWMLPAALIAILAGVWLSNLPVFDGPDGAIWLGRVLAAFLAYVIYANIRKLIADRDGASETLDTATVTPARGVTIGSIMGTLAGLMGIGGGAIAVPLQQILLKLPLRNAIANSAAIITLTAAAGAIAKNATLAEHAARWQTSLILAACLAPTAIAGGFLGARLTHTLPLRTVRIVFIGLLVAAMLKMLGLF